jgi:hypothetical protein
METKGPETHCRDKRSTTALGRTEFSESPSREETEKVSASLFAAAAAVVIQCQLKSDFLYIGPSFGLYMPQKRHFLITDAKPQCQGSPYRFHDGKSTIKAGSF